MNDFRCNIVSEELAMLHFCFERALVEFSDSLWYILLDKLEFVQTKC